LLFSRFSSERHSKVDIRPVSSADGTEWSIGTFYAGRRSRFDAAGANQLSVLGRPSVVCLERKAQQKRIIVIHHAGKTNRNPCQKKTLFINFSMSAAESVPYGDCLVV
jgi:hypothetical protein